MLKVIKDILHEENNVTDQVRSGKIDINDPDVRENINSLLMRSTAGKFLTPYIGLQRVAKVLANFHIPVPNKGFMEGEMGSVIIPAEQFGEKIGVTNDGNVITKEDDEYSIFFEWQLSDCGMFEIFCHIVDEEELEEILADMEAEANDEPEEEEMNEERKTLSELSIDKYVAAKKEAAKREKQAKENPSGTSEKFAKYYGMVKDRAERRIKAKLAEQTTDNDAPLANRKTIKGASEPVPSSLQKKNVPTRGTKDLDQMNKDSDGNTVVEGSLTNKMKKKFAILALGGEEGDKPNVKSPKAVKKARAKLNPKVNDFDIRNLKIAEEKIDEVSKELASRYLKKARSSYKTADSRARRAYGEDPYKFDDAMDQRDRRKKGMAMARKIVAKEDTIDEVSAETVGKLKTAVDIDGKKLKTKTAERTLDRRHKAEWLKSKVGTLKEDDKEKRESDGDKASRALRKVVAKQKLKDAQKETRPGYVKKQSQDWYNKMTKRANTKIDEENDYEVIHNGKKKNIKASSSSEAQRKAEKEFDLKPKFKQKGMTIAPKTVKEENDYEVIHKGQKKNVKASSSSEAQTKAEKEFDLKPKFKQKGMTIAPKTVKEEELDEGISKMIKNVKRGLKGWPSAGLDPKEANKDRPKDVVRRAKQLAKDDPKMAEKIAKSETGKGSPADLQRRVIQKALTKK